MKKQVISTKYCCDICGKSADGHMYIMQRVNDDIVGEYNCPFDLCKEHMKLFEYFLYSYKGNLFRVLNERYESASDSQNLDTMKEFKEYLENDDDEY